MHYMRHTTQLRTLGVATAIALAAALATPAGLAGASPAATAAPAKAAVGDDGGDLAPVAPDYNNGKSLPLDKSSIRAMRKQASAAAAADSGVGDSKTWLALDDAEGGIYAKTYTLRGLGDHIQVWVADDREFPTGDCRNDLALTDITDAQVDNFVSEFDSNIYPKESESFSVPPSLDGTDAPLAGMLGEPADYYQVTEDQADDIVVLVDNVRDANFYDPTTPDGQTYIAGFFYSLFNNYVNRNVMTIDAFDWLHRTGATPPDDSADQAYIDCAAALGQTRPFGTPRPRLYEGTFAHEYQHLLESYEDADEASWVNEGLSDYAQSLVGYVDTTLPPDDPAADGHLACFSGYLGEDFGGPENSLTNWQDQGAPEILCDYGAAYSFMQYLFAKYGEGFMSALHREDGNGLVGLDTVLDQYGSPKSAMNTVHDWAAMMALDGAIDRSHRLRGGSIKWLTANTLSSKINWDTEQAYSTPGAPPNGSDYVRLRGAGGHYLSANQIKTIRFSGAKTLDPLPVEWTVSATPPDATTDDTTCGSVPEGTGDAALYSGCGSNLDRSIVQTIDVPAAGGQLTYDALWDTEEGWDAGFAQVSTDGGDTWTSLASEDTTTDHDPGAIPGVVSNLPGLTGDSGTWRTQHADLSAYAGQSVLLGFRYITDSGVDEGGFWVRNIDVAGTSLSSSSIADWQSITQVNPIAVPGFNVRLVAYDAAGHSWTVRLPKGRLITRPHLRWQAGHHHGRITTVAAIVMMDDPSETITQYGRYTLKVNGVLQPGG
ncbi:putative exported peptidase M6-like protein [metagenome]|uniref:Putative exported peptidase M6-like protein n=1 Tax=metagenome TaxID=256318 RepID=A0A2P2C561_9ZZZZ